MASGNKALGSFNLEGIPAAPRGVPQVEVTFDIDANGIVNVSAKDKATKKEQKITITGGSGLSDEDIEKMVKEAESHAEEDKKKKEEVETLNQADALVYTIEKQTKDMGDKIPKDQLETINKQKEELKKLIEAKDIPALKTKLEEINKILHEASTKMYQEAMKQEQEAKSSEVKDKKDDVVDAEVVDEEKKD